MIDILRIALRGFWIVSLTALNVWQVSHEHYVGAFVGGFFISATWWTNAHASAHSHVKYGAIWYGLGAGVGTMAGLAAGTWFYS